MAYAARLADWPTDWPTDTTSGRRPTADGPRRTLAATIGPTATSGPTADGPTLAARLAAVSVTNDNTSKGPATTSTSATASGKDGPKGDNIIIRQIIIYNIIKSDIIENL